MQIFQLLTLLPLALATPLFKTRQACPNPTEFGISGLTGYTPDPVQNLTANSSVSFTFTDDVTGVSTLCVRTGPLSGPGDVNNFYLCKDPNVSFLYGGYTGPFDIKEVIDCVGGITETAIANSSSIEAPYCFSIGSGFPAGLGTLCESEDPHYGLEVTAIEQN